MIKVENLTITSRQPILKAFSFNFEKDNIYQIMAENGAGKSTFLRALTQLVKYEEGSFMIISHINKARKRCFSLRTTVGLAMI